MTIKKAGVQAQLYCNQEVILCGGSTLLPRILLASGIGDRDELQQLNIVCKQHVPGVGENLQDHIDRMVTVRSRQSDSMGVSLKSLLPHVLPAPFKYLLSRKGWWTTNYVEAGGFAKKSWPWPLMRNPMCSFTLRPCTEAIEAKSLNGDTVIRSSLVFCAP